MKWTLSRIEAVVDRLGPEDCFVSDKQNGLPRYLRIIPMILSSRHSQLLAECKILSDVNRVANFTGELFCEAGIIIYILFDGFHGGLSCDF